MPQLIFKVPLTRIVSLLLLLFTFLQSPAAQNYKPIHAGTVWRLMPSVKYDAFCLLNVLTGDPFYTKYYPRVYRHYDSLFTDKVRKSLVSLNEYKTRKGMILSAYLCNAFYQLPDSSLSGLLLNLKDRNMIKKLLSRQDYSAYSDIRNDIINVFEFLIENDFEKNYNADILPQLNSKIQSLLPLLNKYNIVYNIEKTVGRPLKTDTIRFYVVKYAKPHGISINNTIFLSDVSYDINTSLKVAIHEMMHPYFIPNTDEIKTAINSLKKDSFIYNAFVIHDKSFGYNDFEGYINEASVRALEHVISRQFNLRDDENEHWKTEDKGMHVFSAILVYEMTRYNFPGKPDGTFAQLLLRTIEDVNISGGEVLFNNLYKAKL